MLTIEMYSILKVQAQESARYKKDLMETLGCSMIDGSKYNGSCHMVPILLAGLIIAAITLQAK
jgi:hypothetical protein